MSSLVGKPGCDGRSVRAAALELRQSEHHLAKDRAALTLLELDRVDAWRPPQSTRPDTLAALAIPGGITFVILGRPPRGVDCRLGDECEGPESLWMLS